MCLNMILDILNFGPIHTAKVEINGLSVIAGDNDTGKSTIGKALFSLIKGVQKSTEINEEVKNREIIQAVEDVYFSSRKMLGVSLYSKIREYIFPPTFFDDIKLRGISAVESRKNSIYVIEHLLLDEDSIYKDFAIKFNRIHDLIEDGVDPISVQIKSLSSIIHSEFKGGVVNRYISSNVSKLKLVDSDIEILSCDLHDGKVKSFQQLDLIQYVDITYVDSPAVVNFISQIDISGSFDAGARSGSKPLTIPLHYKDLLTKLKNSKYYDDEPSVIEKEISGIYGGKFSYNEKDNDFVYKNNKGVSASSINIAAGIKSLGILNSLVVSGLTNDKTILIIDEPEVNLHPKWQLEYARIICELVSMGGNILVNTHSPYIVEALKAFSVRKGIRSNFYYAEKIAGGHTELRSLSSDIGDILEALAAPFQRLYEDSCFISDDYDL